MNFPKTFLLCIVLLVAALAEDKVIELKYKDFNNGKVTDKDGKVNGRWFIKFFAPWCPHCQRLAPEWSEMSTQLTEDVKVGGVDCTKEENLCTNYNVFSYPTIVYMEQGLGQIHYDGSRKAEDLRDWINEKKYLNESNTKKEVPKVKQIGGFEKLKKMFGFS